jgi:hypothetical protein
MRGEGGVARGLRQLVQLYTGAQINFGDLTPYLYWFCDSLNSDVCYSLDCFYARAWFLLAWLAPSCQKDPQKSRETVQLNGQTYCAGNTIFKFSFTFLRLPFHLKNKKIQYTVESNRRLQINPACVMLCHRYAPVFFYLRKLKLVSRRANSFSRMLPTEPLPGCSSSSGGNSLLGCSS